MTVKSTSPCKHLVFSDLASVGLICKLLQKFRLTCFILKLYSSKNTQRQSSSISKKNKRKKLTKATEEMSERRSKGKKSLFVCLFVFLLKLLTRISGIMSWVLEWYGDVLLMQRNYFSLLMFIESAVNQLPK